MRFNVKKSTWLGFGVGHTFYSAQLCWMVSQCPWSRRWNILEWSSALLNDSK